MRHAYVRGQAVPRREPGRRARVRHGFGQDLDLCKGRVVCPDAAAAFSRCTHLVINHTGIKAETPDCSRALRELRRCLKGRGV